MNTQALEHSFSRMGARVKFSDLIPTRWNPDPQMTLDVSRDEKGEHFLIRRNPADLTQLIVLDVQPKDRHLLLLTKNGEGHRAQKGHYLMGHDERHWFVAGLQSPVSRVVDAKRALKPQEVIQASLGHSQKKMNKRRNSAFVRQGEWFFIPRPTFEVQDGWRTPILKNEPLQRGRAKPHLCSELYRSGGEQVHVSRNYPNGLTDSQFAALSLDERNKQVWRIMTRGASVWVRGTVRHPDHATIRLDCWHQVVLNREWLTANVAFLD